MNIGFFSDDLDTISFHPGKSRYFLVAAIDDAGKISGVKKTALCDMPEVPATRTDKPSDSSSGKGFCKRFRGGHIEVSGGTLWCEKKTLFEGVDLIVCRGIGFKLENIIKNSGAGLDLTGHETIAGYLQNHVKLGIERITAIIRKT